jgi:molybdopterin converting factor small subunit
VTVGIRLPTMLAGLVGGGRHHEVATGESVADVLAALTALYPELVVHLFDEAGALRPHVRCFKNESGVFDLATPVEDGDTITVLQAVSGG